MAFPPTTWKKSTRFVQYASFETLRSHIQTWINGVKAADFKDGLTLKGLIALQVHGIGGKKPPGEEVRWRNLRIKEL